MLSEDSKWRILKAVQRKEKVTEIEKMFGSTRGSVYDIVNQYKETGNAVRKIMYTTNAVESTNSSFHKMRNGTTILFPTRKPACYR